MDTLVNQKALVVETTSRSGLFYVLVQTKNGRKGKQTIYLFLFQILSELIIMLFSRTMGARKAEKTAVYEYVMHLKIYLSV